MPSPYRAIFAAPGTKRFSAAGLLGRMPLSMMGIGIVTMVSQLTGRYGLAGALSATLAMSAAVLGPYISRLVDRHGQRRVLRPATLAAVAAVAGLLVCAQQGAPDWSLFVFSAAAGCVPSVGSMVRARWAELYRGDGQSLHAAYSWESIVDELCFIVGPILSIGLSTAWFAEAGPLMAAGFLVVGVFWLTAQRATEPVPHPREHHTGGSALRSPASRSSSPPSSPPARSSARSTWSRWPSRTSAATRRRPAWCSPCTRWARASRERCSGCCASRAPRPRGGWWECVRWR